MLLKLIEMINIMLKVERQAKILQAIRDNGVIETDALTNMFGVSHVTIRRDLNDLAEQNLIKLEHGGATSIFMLEGYPEPMYETKIHFDSAKKIAMAKVAMELISNGDTLLIDAGTTTYFLAEELAKQGFNELTIITPDIKVGCALTRNPNYQVIMLGGVLRKSFYNVYGTFIEDELDRLWATKVFLTFDCASISRGLSLTIFEEISIKHKMLNISDRIFAYGDSSKFGKEGLYDACGWEKISCVIVDDAIDNNFLNFFDQRKIQYRIGIRE